MPTKVNGFTPDWANIEIRAGGAVREGVTEINYSESIERAKARGTGRRPKGITDGTYDVDSADMTMNFEEWLLLRNDLAKGGKGYMRQEFNIEVAFSDDAGNVHQDQLKTVRLKKVGRAFKQGNEPLQIKLDLDVLEPILSDGMDALGGRQ